jgi:hypothetical protein
MQGDPFAVARPILEGRAVVVQERKDGCSADRRDRIILGGPHSFEGPIF